jgi:hypothetical protein
MSSIKTGLLACNRRSCGAHACSVEPTSSLAERSRCKSWLSRSVVGTRSMLQVPMMWSNSNWETPRSAAETQVAHQCRDTTALTPIVFASLCKTARAFAAPTELFLLPSIYEYSRMAMGCVTDSTLDFPKRQTCWACKSRTREQLAVLRAPRFAAPALQEK